MNELIRATIAALPPGVSYYPMFKIGDYPSLDVACLALQIDREQMDAALQRASFEGSQIVMTDMPVGSNPGAVIAAKVSADGSVEVFTALLSFATPDRAFFDAVLQRFLALNPNAVVHLGLVQQVEHHPPPVELLH